MLPRNRARLLQTYSSIQSQSVKTPTSQFRSSADESPQSLLTARQVANSPGRLESLGQTRKAQPRCVVLTSTRRDNEEFGDPREEQVG